MEGEFEIRDLKTSVIVDAGGAELAGRHTGCANRVLAVSFAMFELMGGNQRLRGDKENRQNQVKYRFVAEPGHW